MTPTQARRVAKFHAHNPGCALFEQYRFSPGMWRVHFESDLRELRQPPRREPGADEVAAIEAFLSEQEPRTPGGNE